MRLTRLTTITQPIQLWVISLELKPCSIKHYVAVLPMCISTQILAFKVQVFEHEEEFNH